MPYISMYYNRDGERSFEIPGISPKEFTDYVEMTVAHCFNEDLEESLIPGTTVITVNRTLDPTCAWPIVIVITAWASRARERYQEELANSIRNVLISYCKYKMHPSYIIKVELVIV